MSVLTQIISDIKKRSMRMQGETPKSTTDLCASCKYSWIREHYNGKKVVNCEMDRRERIASPVVRCNWYSHRNNPDLYELEKSAWIITGDAKGKLGFRAWKDMTPSERDDAGVRSR